ncbi:UNVERIFIED_CONTAM: hypothetical protein K2H54_064570 [Gekko kuhli]
MPIVTAEFMDSFKVATAPVIFFINTSNSFLIVLAKIWNKPERMQLALGEIQHRRGPDLFTVHNSWDAIRKFCHKHPS